MNEMTFHTVSWLKLAILIAIVIAISMAIVLLFRSGRSGRKISAIIMTVSVTLGVVLLLLALAIPHYRPMRSESGLGALNGPAEDITLASPDPGQNSSLPTIWLPDMDQGMRSDIYPSIQLAASALTDEMRGDMDGLFAADRKPVKVYLCARTPAEGNLYLSGSETGSNHGQVRMDNTILKSLVAVLKKALPDAEYICPAVEPVPVDAQALVLIVYFDISRLSLQDSSQLRHAQRYGFQVVTAPEQPQPAEEPAALTPEEMVASSFVFVDPTPPLYPAFDGQLTIEMKGEKNSLYRAVNFINKPWLADLAGFINQSSANHHWMVAYSAWSWDNAAQAHQDALGYFIGTIVPEAWHPNRGVKPGVNLTELEGLIKRFGMMQDSFVQPLKGSASTIWREAILMDVAPDKVPFLRTTIERQLAGMQPNRIHQGMIMGGLLVIIFLVYLFLNYATKGYYSIMLRILAALAVVAGGIILVSMA